MFHVLWVMLSFLLMLTASSASKDSEIHSRHTVLVIVGGTGDLAAKYLWQGVFRVFQDKLDQTVTDYLGGNVSHTFDFFAAGRSKQEKGNVALSKILTNSLTCNDGEDLQATDTTLCMKRMLELKGKVTYVTLKEQEDFTFLCKDIFEKFDQAAEKAKKEVILFLALPPTATESVIRNFNSQCQAVREKKVSVKVALEKPFGMDKASAAVMSKHLLSYFTEEELFLVDHYLSKPVVQAILPFRLQNPDIEKLLDKDHVARVELFLKEKIGLEDRIDVYNKLGVLRDIHQNHLTQLLTLVSMDLPSDLTKDEGIQENKGRLLRQVEAVRRHNSLFGQYSDYANQMKDSGSSNDSETENLPTFAASVVKINSPRWHGVPFLLVSGKQMDSRESYVRIVFKNNYVCVSQCQDEHLKEESRYTKQLIFHIGHGNIQRPSILVAKSLPSPLCPDNFLESIDPKLFIKHVAYGENFKHFHACAIVKNFHAYHSVFSNMLDGKKSDFVPIKHLGLSWEVWDYLVSARKQIRVYDSADPHGQLNFMIKESQLEFLHSDDEPEEVETDEAVVTHSEVMHDYMQTPASFLGRKLITSHSDHLAFILARDIDQAAATEIQNKGSFHLALSGGTSLTKVFQMLAQSFANLHWHSVHVWQVDERCVPHQDERSNFQMMDRELLRFVDIPYSNIHAMPVYAGGRLCDTELSGAHAYADTLRHIVPNSQLDFVVLGLGADGHTASLFPSSSDVHVDSNTFVVTTEDGPPSTSRRMTLTLPLINKAKHVGIFVTGKHKKDIVNKLESENTKSVDTYPILGVNPINGTVTWYMDYDAYAG